MKQISSPVLIHLFLLFSISSFMTTLSMKKGKGNERKSLLSLANKTERKDLKAAIVLANQKRKRKKNEKKNDIPLKNLANQSKNGDVHIKIDQLKTRIESIEQKNLCNKTSKRKKCCLALNATLKITTIAIIGLCGYTFYQAAHEVGGIEQFLSQFNGTIQEIPHIIILVKKVLQKCPEGTEYLLKEGVKAGLNFLKLCNCTF